MTPKSYFNEITKSILTQSLLLQGTNIVKKMVKKQLFVKIVGFHPTFSRQSNLRLIAHVLQTEFVCTHLIAIVALLI
jgi:hypothetical protein